MLAELADEDFLTLDADGRISAAYPFSVAPTGVEVELPGGVTVSAMCAIDALGIPAMLRHRRADHLDDPVTGYLRFFASRESAEQFVAGHPEAEGTILDQQAAQRLGEGLRRDPGRRRLNHLPVSAVVFAGDLRAVRFAQ